MRKLTLFLLLALSGPVFAKNYFVVVRGSSGYENYRHEADAYHFVKMLLESGTPRSQIVMMTYNDIAFNVENPKKGFIENQINGTNVYLPDFKPDYVGSDVNPKNFLDALQGLPSTKQDSIWIYFTDHGGTKLIAFPDNDLYADDLIAALKNMYQDGKYGKLFFYLEACESGSMFNGLLPDDINIYAITAATPYESSWACCEDPAVGAYTGDEWSVNFLNDLHRGLLKGWSFNDQFAWTRRFTLQSTPCQYGNLSMGDLAIGEFWANGTSLRASTEETFTSRDNGNLKSPWEMGTTVKQRNAMDILFYSLAVKFSLEDALQQMEEADSECRNRALRDMDMGRYKRLMVHYPDRSYLKHTRVLALLSTPSFAHISEAAIITMLNRKN
jgi:legumain